MENVLGILRPKLLGGCKYGWGVVGNSDRDTGVVSEICEALNAREVKAQAGCANLHSQAGFGLRLRSERAVARARVGPAINFAGNAKLFIDAEDSREAVSDDVVLCEEGCGRCKNGETEIAKCIKTAVATKLLSNQD